MPHEEAPARPEPTPAPTDESRGGVERVTLPVELTPAEIELDEYSERLERIIGTQREVAGLDHDLQAMIDLICERTQELTGADAGTILMQDGDELVHRAGSGFSAGIVGRRLGIDDTFSGSVYRSNRSAICHDTAALANPLALQRGIGSIVAVPLRHGDDTVGILSVLSQRPHSFADRDLKTLELLSVVLSAAISNAAEFDARRAQVEALARFRTVFEGASVGIVRCDLEGHTLEANPALERMLGYTAAELATMRFSEFTHPDDVEESLERFHELVEGARDSYRLEKRYYRKDGEVIWSRIAAVVEVDEDLFDGPLAEDEDEAGQPILDGDEIDPADARRARLGRRRQACRPGEPGQRRGRQAEPVLARELHLAELVADHQLLDRRELAGVRDRRLDREPTDPSPQGRSWGRVVTIFDFEQWLARVVRCLARDDRKARLERANTAEAEWSPATDDDKAVAFEKVEAR
jgi:PAS domain S-box-containing protein